MNDISAHNLKLPPHSIEAERALLGAVLTRNEVLDDIDLTAESFYRSEHRAVFAVMRTLHENRQPIDIVTVCEAGGGEDWIDLLAEIQEENRSAANASHYATIVQERYLDRRLISAANDIADRSFNPEGTIQERIDKAGRLLADIEVRETDEPSTIDSCLKSALDRIDERFNAPDEIRGLRTGFADIDKRTSGLQRGDLVLVAARPSMGKTTLAMNIAEYTAMHEGFVIVFSLEMSKEDLTMRMFASVGKLPHDRVKSGKLHDGEWPMLTAAVSKLKGRSYFIDDNPMITSGQLLSRARKISNRVGRRPDLVVVDYLQLLSDKGDGVERVSTISRNLKLAARELDCPMIVLSQLNRECEKRADKRPLMSDLRDSGSLEQDADIVLMLYRDEVYNENTTRQGVAEIIFRKFRNGQIGTDYLVSILHQCRFEDMAHGYVPPEPRKATRRELDYAD